MRRSFGKDTLHTNMKQTTKLIALLLAAAMALSFAGCLVPDKDKEADATVAPKTDGPAVDTSNYDRDAVAIELGSVKITAGEIEDSYNYYVSMLESYYGVQITDDESIKEYRDMAINDLIRYYLPQWKAETLGVKLSAEEEAAIEQDVNQQIEDLRTSLICEYAYYYGGAAEIADDIAKLSEEELDLAMEQINAELTEYFYEGYTLEQYLAEQQKSMMGDRSASALTDKLREEQIKELTVTDEQVDAWYASALASQQEEIEKDPLAYRDYAESFRDGDSAVPALVVPEGVLRVQLIEIAPEAERDLKIETNRAEMAELEAEYGRLALNGEKTERQEEILARYLELKTENDVLEEAFIGDARMQINRAYEALEEETPFEDVMKQYNVDGFTGETLLYTEGDERYGELCDYAAELLVGTYSEPILIDDVYYIVMLIEKPQAGVVDRATIADAIRAAAAANAQDEAWTALYAEWEKEAATAAIHHEDAYAAIGYLN